MCLAQKQNTVTLSFTRSECFATEQKGSWTLKCLVFTLPWGKTLSLSPLSAGFGGSQQCTWAETGLPHSCWGGPCSRRLGSVGSSVAARLEAAPPQSSYRRRWTDPGSRCCWLLALLDGPDVEKNREEIQAQVHKNNTICRTQYLTINST